MRRPHIGQSTRIGGIICSNPSSALAATVYSWMNVGRQAPAQRLKSKRKNDTHRDNGSVFMNCSVAGPFSLFHFISLLYFGAGAVFVHTYAALTFSCSWWPPMERIAVLCSPTSNRVVRLKSKGINLLKRMYVCVRVCARRAQPIILYPFVTGWVANIW